jgi:hypothetical protein
MTNFINKTIFLILFMTILIATNQIYAQSNNNAFVFNGQTSLVYTYDDPDPNVLHNSYQFFDDISEGSQITVQAWIYLLGDTPFDSDIPIIYRALNDETTFSLYLRNNKGYFSIGDSEPVETPEFNAFRWIALTGLYDGTNLKIYLDGELSVSTAPDYNNSGPVFTHQDQNGLFIGNSDQGALKGLIDEVRIFHTALGENNINNSGGNGNPAENFPYSIAEDLSGQWSFTEIVPVDGGLLHDLSDNKNHLRVENITEIVPSKNLPFLVVTSILDESDALPGDGKAISLNGNATLRSAIEEANVLPGPQTIYFYITESAPVIEPVLSALPAISAPSVLDGTVQKDYAGSPIVQVLGEFGGLTLSGGGSTLLGLAINNTSGFGLAVNSDNNVITENDISNNSGHGLVINGNSNTVSNNIIYNNGLAEFDSAGIFVESGDGNAILSNSIYRNTGLGIQLASGANDSQQHPVLSLLYTWQEENTSEPKGGTYIQGTLNSSPGENYRIQFFANTDTSTREGERFLAQIDITTDLNGQAEINANLKDVVFFDNEIAHPNSL